MADAVGKDDEVHAGIEELPGLKEHAGELLRQEVGARAGGAVQDEHRIADDASRIPARRSQRAVVQPELGQHLTAVEPELAKREVARRWSQVVLAGHRQADESGEDDRCGEQTMLHGPIPSVFFPEYEGTHIVLHRTSNDLPRRPGGVASWPTGVAPIGA